MKAAQQISKVFPKEVLEISGIGIWAKKYFMRFHASRYAHKTSWHHWQ